MKSSNVAALDKLLHDDLLFIVPSGETITKGIDIETYRNGSRKIVELNPDIEELSFMDELAVITLKMSLNGSYSSQQIEVQYYIATLGKNSRME